MPTSVWLCPEHGKEEWKMTDSVKKMIRKFGLPRIIIVLFFLFLVVCAGAFQMNLPQFFSDVLRRWGMYGVLALAMVPAIQCGI